MPVPYMKIPDAGLRRHDEKEASSNLLRPLFFGYGKKIHARALPPPRSSPRVPAEFVKKRGWTHHTRVHPGSSEIAERYYKPSRVSILRTAYEGFLFFYINRLSARFLSRPTRKGFMFYRAGLSGEGETICLEYSNEILEEN